MAMSQQKEAIDILQEICMSGCRCADTQVDTCKSLEKIGHSEDHLEDISRILR
jgi:hypothetical protein